MDWFEKGIVVQRPMLMRLAMKFYRDVTAAEDAVQDTFMRALANRASFARGSNLAAWLTTILKNAFLAGARRNWNQRVILTGDPGYADHIPSADNPERAIIVSETYSEFESELVEAQKSTLMLLGLGFTYQQVAEHEDISEGTVKSRAKRGRDRLAEMVGAI